MSKPILTAVLLFQNLPNTAHHPQLHLEIPNFPFAYIAIDTIGKLPIMSSGNKYALTCINLLTSYIIAVLVPNKAPELDVEVYLSGSLSSTSAPWYVYQTMDPI